MKHFNLVADNIRWGIKRIDSGAPQPVNFSPDFPDKARLKNPKAIAPEIPSDNFSSYEREEVRKEIPPTAMNRKKAPK
ncbi:hypothetical protein [Bacillus sp. B-jedd]|uniref:hypothetical protein n=1 Tax=Bacillus sp. B-jedd TaxID=1476857 RepID=UPI000662540B|nr:hypothetical protein [Bacillus sp. B-jedd]